MDYLCVQNVSEKWGISKRRIQILCREGRIAGAKRVGNMWVIPENTEKPLDARKKTPVKTEGKQTSFLRRDLKKLLKELYQDCEKKAVSMENRRACVLSYLAVGLCQKYFDEKANTEKLFYKIYVTLSGNRNLQIFDKTEMVPILQYIRKYKKDPELDNIVSWAYQYSNQIWEQSDYSRTQFFTEKYMIDYLAKNTGKLSQAEKIVDPCCGGGNFLVECLEILCKGGGKDQEKNIIENVRKLVGYDIDRDITRVALVNIRLRALAIMSRNGKQPDLHFWDCICPRIYCEKEKDIWSGSLSRDGRTVNNIITGTEESQEKVLGNADVILTNPPFATVKGMSEEQKNFLKETYPDTNCDMCVAFLERIHGLLGKNGICGIVTQNAWMHLKSFQNIRKQFIDCYTLEKIVNLGSGAFFDLSGEKSNVSLMIMRKGRSEDQEIQAANLANYTLNEKIEILTRGQEKYIKIRQTEINGSDGFDFSGKGTLKKIEKSRKVYGDIGVPMQGTSTGNAKKLVGYFWEHFGDSEWKLVSKGGGYCRWEGLNSSVVKWGKEGEYIREEEGSALRNTKYFPETQMVFSDTGTAGLNVRILLKDQIFIASGPGIRVLQGNPYAHLAFLNSRIASWYLRMMSPKLTIAAGYIARLPIKESLYTSVVLEKNAELCTDLKRKFLSARPNSIEYDPACLNHKSRQIDECAWELLHADLENELLKLEMESRSDRYILQEFQISGEEEKQLDREVGKCAYDIREWKEFEPVRLDEYLNKLLDASCMLKRTRTSRNSLGSDGILEFASKDLHVNPELLVKKIQEDPSAYGHLIEKYRNLILHNEVLLVMGYDAKTGFTEQERKVEEVEKHLEQKYCLGLDVREWMEQEFMKIHTGIFREKPCLMYEKGVVKTYAD